MIATIHGTVGLTWLLGVLIVVGSLIAAAFAGQRGQWLACLLLIVVAIFAAALLL